jgi:P27 family predicted phage terminase small subunit
LACGQKKTHGESFATELKENPMENSTPGIPRAPKGLSLEARSWWKRINANWELDDAGLLYLQNALESFDEMRAAQAILRREGLIIRDRFGQQRQNPATLVERDARMAMARYFRALNLDIEPLNERPGRKPGK